ncbi:unnamed protein product [Meganyctiphanes norvegica]|uniref:FAS1 domain-containing protein n=1 Tax=Meganyctiphanes norvegica TaxID=48144 RepID=A0AAV2R6E7_MEGNR
MTRKILTIILLFKIYNISRVKGKHIPLDDTDASQETSETQSFFDIGAFLHLTSGSHNSDLQESPHVYLENLDVIENTELVENTYTKDHLSLLRNKKFSKFLDLIEEEGVLETFKDLKGYPITVFAPTNDAFQSLDEKNFQEYTELQPTVFSHIVFGEVHSKTLYEGEKLQSYDGTILKAELTPFTLNGHLVLKEILASNGVFYEVSGILTLPPTISEVTSGLNLPQWQLEYLPPPPRDNSTDFTTSNKSINYLMDELKNLGLTKILDLIIEAGLEEKLSDEGTLTMFAPSNDAFSRLESTVYHLLLKKPNLENLLLNHIVNKRILSSDIEDQDTIESLGSAVHKFEIKPTASSQDLLVSGVRIVKADSIGPSIVVHILGEVIIR